MVSSFLLSLAWKLKGYIMVGLAVLAAGAYIIAGQRRAAKDKVTTAIAKERESLQRKYDEIDNRRPDFDSSIGRLRKRSGGDQ